MRGARQTGIARDAVALVITAWVGMTGCSVEGPVDIGAGEMPLGIGDCRDGWCMSKAIDAENIIAPVSNATLCTQPTDCKSGFCADGVCCNSACTSTCQACTAAKKGSGADGVCGNIASASDPDNECLIGNCNGSGACNGVALFANGPACSTGSQCASSFCVDGVCCNNACTSTCQACTAAKKGSNPDGVCGNIAIQWIRTMNARVRAMGRARVIQTQGGCPMVRLARTTALASQGIAWMEYVVTRHARALVKRVRRRRNTTIRPTGFVDSSRMAGTPTTNAPMVYAVAPGVVKHPMVFLAQPERIVCLSFARTGSVAIRRAAEFAKRVRRRKKVMVRMDNAAICSTAPIPTMNAPRRVMASAHARARLRPHLWEPRAR